MKIALDMRTLNVVTGGVERYTVRLYQELLNKHAEKLYPFPFDYESKFDLGFKKKLDFSMEISTSDWDLSKKTELFLCEMNQIDLLFSPYVPTSSVGSYKKILTIHDVIPLTAPELVSSPGAFKFLNEDIRAAASTCDLIITDSEFSKKEIVKCYDIEPGKVKVIYLGHDLEEIDDSEIEKPPNDFMFTDTPYLLTVGALEKRKNLVKVLQVFERIKQQPAFANYKLVVTGALRGDNSEFDEVFNNHPFKQDIIITGFVDDAILAQLYKNTAAFLFLTLYEGFGLPVLEAMALGAPVLTSNNSSIPEVGGDAVLYCDPTNLDDIEKCLMLLLNDERAKNELIRKGKERASIFTWEKTADEIWSVFEKIINADEDGG